MNYMFADAVAFNGDLTDWDTASVTDMSNMFRDLTTFNQNLSSWDTSGVTNMGGMFFGASAFNQNISGWNTANVTDMSSLFANATSFNQNISSWSTANVTNASQMFWNATSFNQNISGWNTANMTNMSSMFLGATAFDQNIGSWNTAHVTNMASMFNGATACDQNLGSWNVTALTSALNMFSSVTLSTANYDALLNGWDAQTLKPNVIFGGGNSIYCAGATARAHMISADGWVITDGGACSTTAATLIQLNVKFAQKKQIATVRWETGVELNVVGFNVYRATKMNGAYKHLTKQLLPAKNIESIEGAKYRYKDKKVARLAQRKKDKMYFYKLEIVHPDGTSEWSEAVKLTLH